MDIKNIKPTAETEYELDVKKGGPQKIKFIVRFIPLDEIPDHIRAGETPKLSQIIRESLMDAIIGWDLTEDGKPLECNGENKKRALPFLLGLRIKSEGPEDDPNRNFLDSVLGWALAEFAGTAENFLKN